jgi:hypothetical protein
MKAKITHRCLRLIPVVLALALGLFTVMGPAQAMHPDGIINDNWDGVAIKGYDPVAYYTMGAAVKGSEEFVHEWLDTKWLFANAAHRDLFAGDPLAYVPQYGGYCSDATFVDDKADINPTAWRIVNGRLYLFYSEPGAAQWSQDDHAVKQADIAWEHVKAGLAE